MTERRRRFARLSSVIGALPMIVVGFGLYVVGILYSVTLSFTDSKLMPQFSHFVWFDNYAQLWKEPRWLVSVENFFIYGLSAITLNMSIGFLLSSSIQSLASAAGIWRMSTLPLSNSATAVLGSAMMRARAESR